MSGHSDGANTADQLRDLIRENQRLIAELRRRDEALAAVRGLHRSDRAETPFCEECGHCWPCLTQRAVLAAHTEQATETGT